MSSLGPTCHTPLLCRFLGLILVHALAAENPAKSTALESKTQTRIQRSALQFEHFLKNFEKFTKAQEKIQCQQTQKDPAHTFPEKLEAQALGTKATLAGSFASKHKGHSAAVQFFSSTWTSGSEAGACW